MYEERLQAQQKMLQQTTDYLNDLRKELEAKNNDITASVNYASYIQEATVPGPDILNQYTQTGFIFLKPRDIVSGDLPYVVPYGDGALIAAIDCTGHGVPGAMVSMLAYSIFNATVAAYPKSSPGVLLSRVNNYLLESLAHKSRDMLLKEGMDVALVHLEGNTLRFAGARRPLLLVRDGAVQEIDGTHTSIGDKQLSLLAFEEHKLTLQPDDTVYLFSDGIVDQFGGEHGKKLLKKRFINWLQDIHALNATEQQAALEKRLMEWRGQDNPQTDDILVMGFRAQ